MSASAPQTLPSTRAGGQDDVSSNKLPQITECKFMLVLGGSTVAFQNARCLRYTLLGNAVLRRVFDGEYAEPPIKHNLREFVRTHVILAPGACGSVAPSCGAWLTSASCPELPVANRGTSIFNNPSIQNCHFCCPRPPQNAPRS